jgi:hypothetical protein
MFTPNPLSNAAKYEYIELQKLHMQREYLCVVQVLLGGLDLRTLPIILHTYFSARSSVNDRTPELP